MNSRTEDEDGADADAPAIDMLAVGHDNVLGPKRPTRCSWEAAVSGDRAGISQREQLVSAEDRPRGVLIRAVSGRGGK